MNTKLRYLSAAVLAVASCAANAITVPTQLSLLAVQTSPGLFTTTGLCTVSFDSPASLLACPNATYSANTASHIVTGSVGGQYAQPAGDATAYLTVGGNLGAPITITLPAGADYFGFYAGSIDSYNGITFSNAASSLTLSGDQINAFLGAGNAANGSENGYFNVFTNGMFDSVTLSSSQAAFETDNHAFGVASPVPEPESIALFGIGLAALAVGKRRRAK